MALPRVPVPSTTQSRHFTRHLLLWVTRAHTATFAGNYDDLPAETVSLFESFAYDFALFLKHICALKSFKVQKHFEQPPLKT